MCYNSSLCVDSRLLLPQLTMMAEENEVVENLFLVTLGGL